MGIKIYDFLPTLRNYYKPKDISLVIYANYLKLAKTHTKMLNFMNNEHY